MANPIPTPPPPSLRKAKWLRSEQIMQVNNMLLFKKQFPWLCNFMRWGQIWDSSAWCTYRSEDRGEGKALRHGSGIRPNIILPYWVSGFEYLPPTNIVGFVCLAYLWPRTIRSPKMWWCQRRWFLTSWANAQRGTHRSMLPPPPTSVIPPIAAAAPPIFLPLPPNFPSRFNPSLSSRIFLTVIKCRPSHFMTGWGEAATSNYLRQLLGSHIKVLPHY